MPRLSRIRRTLVLLSLSGWLLAGFTGCAFNFGGETFGESEPATPAQPLPTTSSSSESPASEALSPGSPLGNTGPLGLAPLGNDQSPQSQLMSEGTLGYILDHLFGGSNPKISREYLPPSTYGTTTAGGVPGGLWPGNWWIEGQGGGYNLVHLP